MWLKPLFLELKRVAINKIIIIFILFFYFVVYVSLPSASSSAVRIVLHCMVSQTCIPNRPKLLMITVLLELTFAQLATYLKLHWVSFRGMGYMAIPVTLPSDTIFHSFSSEICIISSVMNNEVCGSHYVTQ